MNIAHFIREWINVLVAPVPAALLIMMVALAFRWRRWRRSSRYLLACAAAVAYLGSISVVGDALLGDLERQYPPLGDRRALPAVHYVVVLGSGYSPHDGFPITASLDADGLARIVEGVRLARLLDPVKLVVSGGAPAGFARPAIGYAELARGLGIPATSLLVSDESLTTSAEADAMVKLLGAAPYILVTSAYHMPRAMRLMRRVGTNPIPAPTGQRVNGEHRRFYGLIPSSSGLECTERALHEYLGLLALAAGLE